MSERIRKTTAPEREGGPEASTEGGAPVVRRTRDQVRTKVAKAAGGTKKPEIEDEEEQILRGATLHLIQKYGMFLVATGVREARIKGFRVWIITVTLRHTTGHEGHIGDLLYDGEEYTFLTEQSVMDERARQIADDPERARKWNEFRASPLPPGEG